MHLDLFDSAKFRASEALPCISTVIQPAYTMRKYVWYFQLFKCDLLISIYMSIWHCLLWIQAGMFYNKNKTKNKGKLTNSVFKPRATQFTRLSIKFKECLQLYLLETKYATTFLAFYRIFGQETIWLGCGTMNMID